MIEFGKREAFCSGLIRIATSASFNRTVIAGRIMQISSIVPSLTAAVERFRSQAAAGASFVSNALVGITNQSPADHRCTAPSQPPALADAPMPQNATERALLIQDLISELDAIPPQGKWNGIPSAVYNAMSLLRMADDQAWHEPTKFRTSISQARGCLDQGLRSCPYPEAAVKAELQRAIATLKILEASGSLPA